MAVSAGHVTAHISEDHPKEIAVVRVDKKDRVIKKDVGYHYPLLAGSFMAQTVDSHKARQPGSAEKTKSTPCDLRLFKMMLSTLKCSSQA